MKGESHFRLMLVKLSNQEFAVDILVIILSSQFELLPKIAQPSKRRTPYNITCIAAFPITPFGEFQSQQNNSLKTF
jgi:hypothetical protein